MGSRDDHQKASSGELSDQLADRVKRMSSGMRPHQSLTEMFAQTPVTGVDEGQFWARVRDEMKRSDRYKHPFTVLIVRTDGASESVPQSQILTSVAPGLVRECDIAAPLEGGNALGVLLPETSVAGAAALVERIRAEFSDPDACEVALLEYPATKERLEALAKAA